MIPLSLPGFYQSALSFVSYKMKSLFLLLVIVTLSAPIGQGNYVIISLLIASGV